MTVFFYIRSVERRDDEELEAGKNNVYGAYIAHNIKQCMQNYICNKYFSYVSK